MKKYNIIYADPAWEMGNKSRNRVLVPKYDVMDSKDIIDLPIEKIADDNCALLLWTINAKIPDAIKLIEKIGFRYVGIAFCWVKTSKTTGKPNCRMAGNYTLQGIELCLLAIKGSMETKDRTVRQVQMIPRLFHSKKPDIIADEIVRLFGDLPRVELFARDKKQGWDVWGNEVECDVNLMDAIADKERGQKK
jgi:N6-adenosine-specific RNA methylase IME4